MLENGGRHQTSLRVRSVLPFESAVNQGDGSEMLPFLKQFSDLVGKLFKAQVHRLRARTKQRHGVLLLHIGEDGQKLPVLLESGLHKLLGLLEGCSVCLFHAIGKKYAGLFENLDVPFHCVLPRRPFLTKLQVACQNGPRFFQVLERTVARVLLASTFQQLSGNACLLLVQARLALLIHR